MWYRRICGYSITSYPRSNVSPFAVTTARTWNSPLWALDAGFTSNRTVRDSSARSNLIGWDGGMAVQPDGTSSRTDVSADPVVSFMTVTRISRSAAGGAAIAAAAAGRRAVLAGAACTEAPARPAPAAPRLAVGRTPGFALRIDAAGIIAT